jgi:hypothetical protein
MSLKFLPLRNATIGGCEKTCFISSELYKVSKCLRRIVWIFGRASVYGSDQNDYQKRKRDLKWNVKKRGYSSNLIDKQFQRVDELEHEDLLKHNQPKQSDRVPLVSTYTDALPNIHTILRKHLDTLYNSEEMKQVFSQPFEHLLQ